WYLNAVLIGYKDTIQNQNQPPMAIALRKILSSVPLLGYIPIAPALNSGLLFRLLHFPNPYHHLNFQRLRWPLQMVQKFHNSQKGTVWHSISCDKSIAN